MVLLFPAAIAVELRTRPFVQVDEGYALYGSDVGSPFRLGLAHDSAFIVEGVARCQRHQDGIRPLGPGLADIAAQIVTVGVDRVLTLCTLVETYIARVGVDTGDDGTGPLRIEELAVVVMADGDDDPVARLQGVAHCRPQVGVERAGRHTAKGLVLYRYPFGIEILVGIVAPAPLSVGAVATGTVAHRGVAHEEEHGVLSLACRARLGPRHQGFGYGVRRIVHHLVHIFYRIGEIVSSRFIMMHISVVQRYNIFLKKLWYSKKNIIFAHEN